MQILTKIFRRGKLALKLNMEQKSAVVNIVKAKNFPLPYLLFGPAGIVFITYTQ